MSEFHRCMDEVFGGSRSAPEDLYNRLLDRIESAGYRIEWHNKDLLTDADLADVWVDLEEQGVEQAVSTLETLFGFVISRGR